MIRIRKKNGAWYIRLRPNTDADAIQDISYKHPDDSSTENTIKRIFESAAHEKKTGWSKCDGLSGIRESILRCASNIDHHVRIALAVMNGTSDLYMLEDGVLVSRQRPRYIPFPTLSLRRYENIEIVLKHINSSAWKVRTWTPHESIEIPSDYLSDSEISRREYLILESRDESLVPSENIY